MREVTFIVGLLIILIAGCESDDQEPGTESPGNSKGVFIVSEGNYLYGNSSLSFYDKEKRSVYNELYYAVNKAPLGDVAQSLAASGGLLYIVVNNSGKLVVANQSTMVHKGVISNLPSPRAIHFVNERKAYISDMMAGKITVIDPLTLKVTGTIGVSDGKAGSPGHATENFVQVGDFVFVSCWMADNRVLVINAKTDMIVDSILVPFQPNKMVVDCHEKIWVQTDGEYPGANPDPEKPALVRIDPVSRKVEKIMRLNLDGAWFSDIRLNPAKDSLYFLAGEVFKMDVTSETMPAGSYLPSNGKNYYSLGIDPVSGEIYLGDPADYKQNGMMYRYSPGRVLLDSFRVGICPGDFLFRN